MAEKKQEIKQLLEREYIVPLRKGWLKVPEYKRTNKAVKTLKEFIARHMKVYDTDLRKIKIDVILNNEIRFRGIKKPPAKIKVRARKFDDGIVRVELVNVPRHIEFARLRELKKQIEKKVDKKEEKEEKKDKEVKKEESKVKDKKEEVKKEERKVEEKKEEVKKEESKVEDKKEEPKIEDKKAESEKKDEKKVEAEKNEEKIEIKEEKVEVKEKN